MTSEWASTSGRAKPVTTTMDVMKRPRSMGPEPSSTAAEKSSLPQWANRAFGSGARTNVNATRTGSQLDHSAHDRMISKNPTARTKESKMTVFKQDESDYD